MTIKEIVKKWLEDNGYDGIAGETCGCYNDDLFPCEEMNGDCVAGHKVICPCDSHDVCEMNAHEGRTCILSGKNKEL